MASARWTKRVAWILLIPLALAALPAPTIAAGQGPALTQPDTPTVAIIYDGPDRPLADGFLGAHYVKNLLGHFALRGELIRLADYQPGQLAHYRAVFFLGTAANAAVPEGFLRDVKSSTEPFCWFGQHIEQLLTGADAQHHFGLRYLGYRVDSPSWRVRYKGVLFPKDNHNLGMVEPTDSGSRVLATAVQDDGSSHPYALNRNRFWYFADTDFRSAQEAGRYLVFCDLLHDILGIDHTSQSVALVRLEDVSAEADPSDLTAAANVLGRRNIPFQIATIPLFRNPINNVEMRLSDRPKVVAAIHYLIDRGGTPVMHGWSHQYHGSTGDDYEFWDGLNNAPVAGDSEEDVARRLDAGLAELFADQLFPVAFETPHYAASPVDYAVMQRYFNLFYERTMPTPDLSSVQSFPYPLVDQYGRHVVPENLGFLPKENPDPRILIENARYMRVVRDGVPSFYFHPFLDAKLLDQVLQGISELGYHFVSLREFGGEVDDQERYVVRTQSGPVEMSPHGEFWRLRRFDARGKLLTERTAPAPQDARVKVDVDVPTGGWAALDCYKKTPGPSLFAEAEKVVRDWWGRRETRTGAKETATYEEPGSAWVLWLANPSGPEANNQESYLTALDTFGFSTQRVPVQEFTQVPQGKRVLLVVPNGVSALLTNSQQQEILRYLSSGGVVLADGHQRWLQALGLHEMGSRLPVPEIQETLFEGTSFSWDPEELVDRYVPPPESKTLAFETDSKQPVALAGRHGLGSYVYLSGPLDTHTKDGLSRYPYLAEYLADTFHMRSALRAGRVETYFDPSYRTGVNLDNLAAYWKEAGVRTVYVAAWQFYEHYSFNYAALIRACHRNGISVYAWFMFPQATPLLWQQHPEWREQAAVGGDGRPGWRYLLNFQDPACFRAVMDWAKELLKSQDWDGINIAELNFDAEYPDYLRPDRFVPMNKQVREDFSRRSGFDPAQLFVPGSPYNHQHNRKALEEFLRYREDIVTEWHRRVLEELDPIVSERGMEVIVTAMDSLHSNYVQPALGVDSRRIVALMREFNFTLQVEDPVEHWAEPPERYMRFAEDYRKLVPNESRLMFDINVVSDRDIEGTSLPSATAKGTELARTVMMAAVSGRVAIYAEHTVERQDWPILGSALARPAQAVVRGSAVQVDSPLPVFLKSPKGTAYSVDGQRWPPVSGGMLIPSGDHRISTGVRGFQSLGAAPLGFQGLSCDLLEARVLSSGLALRYRSPGRAVLVVTRKPLGTSVDGQAVQIPVEGHGDEWIILAPRGEHQLDLTMLTPADLTVNRSSLILSSALAVIGAIATFLMLWFYVRLRTNPPSQWRRSEG